MESAILHPEKPGRGSYYDGAGVGASHQTGWTGLVAKLLQQSGA